MPIEKINEMENWEGSRLNEAKEMLAYEMTAMVHGEEEAIKAKESARKLFSAGTAENMPTAEITEDDLTDGKTDILTLLEKAGIASSRSQGRTLISQGGISVEGEKITDTYKSFDKDELKNGLIIKKGKKVFVKVILK